MAEETYESIQKEIVQAKKDARAKVSELEKKKKSFVMEQTFTGEELMTVRNALYDGNSIGAREPSLYHVLEQILENRFTDY